MQSQIVLRVSFTISFKPNYPINNKFKLAFEIPRLIQFFVQTSWQANRKRRDTNRVSSDKQKPLEKIRKEKKNAYVQYILTPCTLDLLVD